jgi:lipoprotein-anchoring transpeptidase ErfK/SrfK
MPHRAFVLVVFAALACAAAPGAARMPTIAPGVTVAGTRVGGMTSEPARTRLERRFARRVVVVHGTKRWTASPQSLGAGAAIDRAVSKALAAAPGKRIGLTVRWSPASIDRFVAGIARTVDRAAVDAVLVGMTGNGPDITPERRGIAVRRALLRERIENELAESLRTPLVVPTRPVPAAKTVAGFGPVIWIDRGTNTLRLYDGVSFVQRFGVATGQAQYPTPAGMWHIVTMQRDPWWIPPNSPWAKGEKPVPPGPGNPLGTRWMGLDAAGVGIHGTPDAASIGYSASHGCIRMHIPDAEWLFDHVSVGTPVSIT